MATAADALADGQAAALRAWGPARDGPWLRRAWLPDVGWLMEDVIEITQQPWPVLAGVFNTSFNAALATQVRTLYISYACVRAYGQILSAIAMQIRVRGVHQ